MSAIIQFGTGVPSELRDAGRVLDSLRAAQDIGMGLHAQRGDSASFDPASAALYATAARMREWVGEDSSARAELSRRADSAGTLPDFLLTERLVKIFEQDYPSNDALMIDHRAETPIGAEFTEYALTDATGDIIELDGVPENVPGVDLSSQTEIRPVTYFVNAVRMDYRERLAAAYAGRPELLSMERKLRAARDIHFRRHNPMVFDGYGTNIYGVFTHPGITRLTGATAWLQSATTGASIVEDFGTFANYLPDQTNDVGSIDTVFLASKLYRGLQSKTYSADQSKTVLSAIMENYPSVDIRPMHSLNDKGPNGEHAMILYSRAIRDALYVDFPQPPTPLPVWNEPLSSTVYVIHQMAGVKSFKQNNVMIGYVPLS